MLGRKLDEHRAAVWLVNTGWTGGPFGEGERMPIAATRALLHAALAGTLEGVQYRTDPVFGFQVPVAVPGVEAALLDPRSTWRDPAAYDRKAEELVQMFRENFDRFAAAEPALAAAGPRWAS
jgi:phosphoenolpyruvate carboxykinase (ATP)